MGRSVMTLSGAEAIAYVAFEPDESFYRSLYDDDLADGIIEEGKDFTDFMYERWDLDSDEEYDALVKWIIEQVQKNYPSFTDVYAEDNWVGSELRIALENAHSIVTISQYNSIVAVCLGAKYDRSEYWGCPTSELSGIGQAWREQISEKFSLLGDYVRLGTFSNGEAVYYEVEK